MSAAALSDLAAAIALVVVIEGLAAALFSTRLVDLLEQLREIDPERVRWAGLGMALIGVVVYLLVRG